MGKSKISVGTKFKWLMIFLVVTLLTSSLASFFTASQFTDQIHDLGETQMPGSSHMAMIDMMHDGIRANVYSSILNSKTTDEELKKTIKAESQEFASTIKSSIEKLQGLNLHAETKEAIKPALPRVDDYIKVADEIVTIALSGNEEEARQRLPAFDQKFEALEKELANLGTLIETDASESTAQGPVIENRGKLINFVTLGFGLTLIVAFALVIREQQSELRAVISQLSDESGRIKTIADQINSGAQNLSSATQQQASAFQQSAAALEEISSTIKATETNSKRLDESSKSSYSSASHGKMTIEQMLQAMDIIKSSNAQMATQIDESNKRISDIVKVISEIETKTKVINDIVFQTKLLSFNASVEAARAGEQGKGFAVVAEEVGNLAQMSGNAAKEISDMLSSSVQTVHAIVNESKDKVERLNHESRNKVEHGFDIANKCGSALEEIVQETSRVGALIVEITTAVQEQAQGINEVSNAMGLLDQASAQNSITSNENLRAAGELQEEVKRLESAVDKLSSMTMSKSA